MRVESLADVVADFRSFHRRRQGSLELAQHLEFYGTGQRQATHPCTI